MARPFIQTSLSKSDPVKLASQTDTITTSMDNNADFPSPPVTITDVKAKVTDLRKYLVNREDLTTNQRKERKLIVDELAEMVRLNGVYVTLLFPNNEQKQLSSGYPPAKPNSRLTVPPGKPYDLKARRGELSGQVVLNCKIHTGTHGLEIQYHNEIPDAPVVTESSTTSRGIEINNLLPGHRYYFRVRAVGAIGNSDWTDEVNLIVV